MKNIKTIFTDFFSKRPGQLATILDAVDEGRPTFVTFLNPYTILKMRSYAELYDQFDYICSDAIVPVLLERMMGFKTQRLSFDLGSVAQPLFEFASEEGKTVYLCGSSEESLRDAVGQLRRLFPRLQIVGFHHGYFEDDGAELLGQIKELQPDIVILGLGVPKQDIVAVHLKDEGVSCVVFTCGGFIHQTAMSETGFYYPEWINRLNLRAFYRIAHERYILKRVMLYYIPFVILYSFFLLWMRVRPGLFRR